MPLGDYAAVLRRRCVTEYLLTRLLTVAATIGAALTVAATPAEAATATATATLSAGSLRFLTTPPNVSFTATLDGTNQAPTATEALDVGDATGSKPGSRPPTAMGAAVKSSV